MGIDVYFLIPEDKKSLVEDFFNPYDQYFFTLTTERQDWQELIREILCSDDRPDWFHSQFFDLIIYGDLIEENCKVEEGDVIKLTGRVLLSHSHEDFAKPIPDFNLELRCEKTYMFTWRSSSARQHILNVSGLDPYQKQSPLNIQRIASKIDKEEFPYYWELYQRMAECSASSEAG